MELARRAPKQHNHSERRSAGARRRKRHRSHRSLAAAGTSDKFCAARSAASGSAPGISFRPVESYLLARRTMARTAASGPAVCVLRAGLRDGRWNVQAITSCSGDSLPHLALRSA